MAADKADEGTLRLAATIYTLLLAPVLGVANEDAHKAAMRQACGRALDLQAAMPEVVEERAKAAAAKKEAEEAAKKAEAEAEKAAKAEAAAASSPGIVPQAHPNAQMQAQRR